VKNSNGKDARVGGDGKAHPGYRGWTGNLKLCSRISTWRKKKRSGTRLGKKKRGSETLFLEGLGKGPRFRERKWDGKLALERCWLGRGTVFCLEKPPTSLTAGKEPTEKIERVS